MENFDIINQETKLVLSYEGSELVLVYNKTENRVKGLFQDNTLDTELTENDADLYFALRRELKIIITPRITTWLKMMLTK